MSMVSPAIATVVQLLRKLWCVRINDLNTYNSIAENGDGRVPSPGLMPGHWLGRWGTDEGNTFICLLSGDLFVLSGEPNSELLRMVQGNLGLCPNGSELRVPYFHEQALYINELLARVRDPYCFFDPTS